MVMGPHLYIINMVSILAVLSFNILTLDGVQSDYREVDLFASDVSFKLTSMKAINIMQNSIFHVKYTWFGNSEKKLS